MSDVWIITGIPGAGKTTVARALARRLPHSAHLEGDVFWDYMITGAVLPHEQPEEEAERQLDLARRNLWLLARSYLEAGFTPILDFVLPNRRRIQEQVRHLPGCDVYLVALLPDIAIALQRDYNRPEKAIGDRWVELDAVMREELVGLGLWVDNGRLTVDETVDYILAHKGEARVGL